MRVFIAEEEKKSKWECKETVMLSELPNAHSARSSHGLHMLLKQCVSVFVRETKREIKDHAADNGWIICFSVSESILYCVGVCVSLYHPMCVYMSRASSLCIYKSLPSSPVRVCPLGSSQLARWVALRAGSPGPPGVLFPATVSRAQLDSPQATVQRQSGDTPFLYSLWKRLQ